MSPKENPKIDNLNPTSIINKMFDANDKNFSKDVMRVMNQYPKQKAKLKTVLQKEMHDRITVNGNFDVQRFENFFGLGKENRAGFHGVPYWKNYTTIGMVNQTHGINFIVKTIGEQNASFESQDPGAFGKTRDHTEVDFRYTFNTSWSGTVAVGGLNIFGIKRPQSVDNGTTGAGYLNAEIYDPVGRAYYMSYTQSF